MPEKVEFNHEKMEVRIGDEKPLLDRDFLEANGLEGCILIALPKNGTIRLESTAAIEDMIAIAISPIGRNFSRELVKAACRCAGELVYLQKEGLVDETKTEMSRL